MTVLTETEFEAQVRRAIEIRDGRRVIALLLQDPRNRFANTFIRATEGVDALFIERAFLQPQATLAAKVTKGIVTDFDPLLKMMGAVFHRVGLKYRVKSYRRANPRVRCGTPHPGQPPEYRPLFVPDGRNLDRYPVPGADPTAGPGYRELLRDVRAGARGLGTLRFRVYREVRQFDEHRGTMFGAFRAVAARAELGPNGRVVRIRPFDAAADANEPPPVAVVRQIRKLFREARAYVTSRARLRG